MRHLHQSCIRLAGLALLLASILVGARAHPATAQVASIDPLVNPVIASRAWDATSGYGALEASRAGLAALIVSDAGDPATGAPVDPRRVQAALAALQGGDLGGVQEAALADVVDQFLAWDGTSGYGAVEASRAGMTDLIAAAPGASVWSGAPVDPRRLQASLGALQASDLGGVQEAALADVVNQFMAWDATSGYGAVEATRAGLTQLLEP